MSTRRRAGVEGRGATGREDHDTLKSRWIYARLCEDPPSRSKNSASRDDARGDRTDRAARARRRRPAGIERRLRKARAKPAPATPGAWNGHAAETASNNVIGSAADEARTDVIGPATREWGQRTVVV